MPYRDIFGPDGSHWIRIQYFHSTNPYWPNGWARYQLFVPCLSSYFQYYKTVVSDSATFLEIEARKANQYVTNATVKDPRIWYGASAQAQEEQIFYHPASWPVNVVVICHESREKDEVHGMFVRGPLLRGKEMSSKIGAAFQEIYHTYAVRNDQGKVERRIQTEADAMYSARTMIQAPDGTMNDYQALWQGKAPWWERLHALVYGEAGTGKSSFAATWPKPILVLFFDPVGKDMPYIQVGLSVGGSESGLVADSF